MAFGQEPAGFRLQNCNEISDTDHCLILVALLIDQAKLVATNVSGKVVQGSGHWLMEEAPDQVIPALVTFLNGNPE